MRSHRSAGAAGALLLCMLSGAGIGAPDVDEVVVTATRREADIQTVPVSLTAFDHDFIAGSGIGTLQDLGPYTPNFSFATSSQPSNVRLVIRGIGSAGNAAIEPAVGVFVDGIYYPRPGSVLGSLVDIERVEILRGPQGTLFGRNTAAGAVSITTASPGDDVERHVEAGIADFGSRFATGIASAPLTAAVGGRIAARYAERDGYGHNELDGRRIGAREDLALRGKLSLDRGGRFDGTLTADYSRIDAGGNVVELDPATVSPAFDATLAALFGATARTADGFDYIVNQDHRDRLADRQWGVAADLRYDLGGHALRSITAFREWRAQTRESALRIPADVLPRLTDYATRTRSQELQLLSPPGERLDYLLGLYVYDESYGIGQDFDAGVDACMPVVFAMAGPAAAAACAAAPQSPAVTSEFAQALTSYAVFAQTTLHATDRLSITLGARYTTEDKRGRFEQRLPNPVIGGLFRMPENEPALQVDDAAVTWLLNARFEPAPDVMVYAGIATGFKGGGFNSEGAATPLDARARTFGDETSTNYELGMRSRLLDDTLVLNATAYRTVLEDFQDRSFDGLGFMTRNAGSRTQQGVEADLTFRPLASLRLRAGASYLDAEFDRFDAASPLPGGGSARDLGGRRPHFSPAWQGSAVADWRIPWSNARHEWFLRGEWQFVGKQNVGSNTNLNPQSMQAAYRLLNLRGGLAGERWSVTVYAKNLAATHYCQVIFDQPLGESLGAVDAVAGTTAQRCVLGEPRLFGASVRYDF